MPILIANARLILNSFCVTVVYRDVIESTQHSEGVEGREFLYPEVFEQDGNRGSRLGERARTRPIDFRRVCWKFELTVPST